MHKYTHTYMHAHTHTNKERGMNAEVGLTRERKESSMKGEEEDSMMGEVNMIKNTFYTCRKI